MKRALMALTALSLLSGCGILEGSGRPHTPTVGTRIPVLATESQVAVDPALAGVPVAVPGPVLNADWPQPGGNAAKSMGHVALGDSPRQAWSVSIGSGSSTTARLAAEPVVAGGRVYTIDTNARVRAFSAENGGLVWERQVRGQNSPSEALFGG
ncbi:MAG: outer membrane protein assembly factor BamB family protein, partial [Allosphingosinicella sp.]